MRQARQIARLVDQHLRFVLKLGDLVVDLLKRAGGGQQVLGVIGRVVTMPPNPPKKACAGGAVIVVTPATAEVRMVAANSAPRNGLWII